MQAITSHARLPYLCLFTQANPSHAWIPPTRMCIVLRIGADYWEMWLISGHAWLLIYPSRSRIAL